MDKKYLPDLISELDQELLRLGYTKVSLYAAVHIGWSPKSTAVLFPQWTYLLLM